MLEILLVIAGALFLLSPGIRNGIAAYWRTAIGYLRILVVAVVSWPFIMALVALTTNNPTVKSIMALLPAIGCAIALFILVGWVVVGAIDDRTRRGLRWLALIAGIELAIGFFFVIIPVASQRGLVPVLLLLAAGLLCFALAPRNTGTKMVMTILGIAIGVITIIFLWGTLQGLFGGLVQGLRGVSGLTLLWIFPLVAICIILLAVISKQPLFAWLGFTIMVILIITIIADRVVRGEVDLPAGGGGGRIYVQAGQEKQIQLLGPGRWSKEVFTPLGTNYSYLGPLGTKIKFQDGTEVVIGSAFTNVGIKRGIFRFSGPAGEAVTVKVRR